MRFSLLKQGKLPGLLFIALLALTAYTLAELPFLASLGISSLVVAIVMGILIGNMWHLPATWQTGIQFSAKRLLRIAIILFGFRISFQQIASVGLEALVIDLFVVIGTILVGYFIGKKVFRLDSELALLISSGAAICGAAAVLAVEDVLKSEPYKASIAVGTVVLFGTLSMFIYPVLQHAGFFGFSDNQFGIFAGASIHEVAQAIVAGTDINSATGEIAMIVKMLRVLLLVPVLILLSFFLSQIKSTGKKIQFTVPWFALGFVAVIAFNSFSLLPPPLVGFIKQLDIILLTMAMGAIGVETKLAKIKKVGMKPLYLAAALFFWLMISVFLMVKVIV